MYDINKISLSCFNNKSYILGDGIKGLAEIQKYIN